MVERNTVGFVSEGEVKEPQEMIFILGSGVQKFNS